MTPAKDIERQVRERAADRCEYCRMHQALQGATFHVEHIRPKSVGGESSLSNLAWACPSCNLQKADRTRALDPMSRELMPLFDPRNDAWNEHFYWNGLEVESTTPIGRATIAALDLNRDRRCKIREAEAMFDLFPPQA